jgi:hypothetical protein
MKNIILTATASVIVALLISVNYDSRFEQEVSEGDEENPHARDEYEFLVQRDPVLGSLPRQIHRSEQEFARHIPTRETLPLSKGTSSQLLSWVERGPNNVGGRTRVFGADRTHPGTLIAGCVAGGIWKSTDDGVSWRLTLTPQQIFSTSCIAQDVRAGKTNTWYVGTGEFRGSTTNNTRWGSFYYGDGIYKSTNNGDSWFLLPATVSGTPQNADPFDFVWNIAVNPVNIAEDEVYAATWKGIYRSSNGGASWNLARKSDSGLVNSANVTTEIAINSTGIKFAHTREFGVQRIWRSVDGVIWNEITPANFPASTGRIVFGTAPSNPNILYVFISVVSNTPNMNLHQLWKYTESLSGTLWENRAANLPSDLSTQTGYDQLVHVKPDDENFVLIGGTNLYRSTDGFATSAKTTTIGGYAFWPDGAHHPDLHSGMFKPSNPGVYYSGNDGGVQRADDITMAGTMNWISLNNGYNVTQFYSVSISSDSGDLAVVAGAQDNGTQFTFQPALSSWTMIYGGDGTIAELAPIASDRIYVQYQSGPLFRQTRAGASETSLAPFDATRQLFVNPIALDPNNPNVLYYGGGKSTSPGMWSGVWRNDNAPNGTSTTGWTAITASDVGTPSSGTRVVSTIGISKTNTPNVVYLGTTDGIIKRIDRANEASPVVTDVTPPGLLGGTTQGGFVRCIAVDPANSNIALTAFGNYNFKNLWYTTNGGSSWTDVEGNLAGEAGPSIRWATLIPGGGEFRVFLATSIGVLSTAALKGDSTIWTHAAANDIGNVLIAYLDYRESDRTIAVGTHGRGVFTTQLPAAPVGVSSSEVLPEKFVLGQNYPNPFNPSTTIRYNVPAMSKVSIRVFDMQGREVAVLVDEKKDAGRYTAVWDAGRFSSGIYFYKLEAGSFVEVKKMLLVK